MFHDLTVQKVTDECIFGIDSLLDIEPDDGLDGMNSCN